MGLKSHVDKRLNRQKKAIEQVMREPADGEAEKNAQREGATLAEAGGVHGGLS